MRALIDVDPSPEQLAILSDAGPGFRLIRGAAGSGKTTATLLRLRQLCGSRLARRRRLGLEEPVRVLVLTFNQTLRGYVSELAKEPVTGSDALRLTIDTFGRWALNLVGQRHVVSGREWRNRVQALLPRVESASRNLEYFTDEVEYAIGRFPSDQRESYLGATRSGRGRAPAVPRRIRQRLLADVIEPFEEQKAERGQSDWNDVAIEAAATHCHGYDVVVVDEAQDFSANQRASCKTR